MSLLARTKVHLQNEGTANSIQRTCLIHLPSIKSWFIPVLLRTLCIMWQCTHNNDWGTFFEGFFTLFLFRRNVVWFLRYEESLRFRIVKNSGMLFSLWLIYHHFYNVMSVPQFTTKYWFFLSNGGEYRITIKYWNGVWQDFVLMAGKGENKLLQQSEKSTEPDRSRTKWN